MNNKMLYMYAAPPSQNKKRIASGLIKLHICENRAPPIVLNWNSNQNQKDRSRQISQFCLIKPILDRVVFQDVKTISHKIGRLSHKTRIKTAT